MPNGFNMIPDWFSFENQGAGVALADLSGGGSRDLVVLMVDNPPGKTGDSIGSASASRRMARPRTDGPIGRRSLTGSRLRTRAPAWRWPTSTATAGLS